MEAAGPPLGGMIGHAVVTEEDDLIRDEVRSFAILRFGFTLIWTEPFGEPTEDLRAWGTALRRPGAPVELARDGTVQLRRAAAGAEMKQLCISYMKGSSFYFGKRRTELRLTFRKEQICESWFSALRLQITPWEDLVQETRTVIRDACGTGLQEFQSKSCGEKRSSLLSSSSGGELAGLVSELKLELERLIKAEKRCHVASEILSAVACVCGPSECLIRTLLGELPLLSAGIQLLALGVSCVASMPEAKAFVEIQVRERMASIAALTLTELFRALSYQGIEDEHLEALSLIMGDLEKTLKELDEYVFTFFVRKRLEKAFLEDVPGTLETLEDKLLAVQAAACVSTVRSMVNELRAEKKRLAREEKPAESWVPRFPPQQMIQLEKRRRRARGIRTRKP